LKSTPAPTSFFASSTLKAPSSCRGLILIILPSVRLHRVGVRDKTTLAQRAQDPPQSSFCPASGISRAP
jgi:hypothetical protein